MTAYLFPGQGSQTPEMRDDVARLRPDLLEAVCDAVGEDPFPRVEEGTRFAQPAILCASLARWSALGDPRPTVLVGHSLGEIGALVAAGALDEGEALGLVAERGRLMQGAGRPGDGMLAVLGADPETVAALAADHGLTLANDNAPGQAVLAGGAEGLRRAAATARADGVRAIRLGVSGAFHSPAMASARPAWHAALARVAWRPAQVRVVSCVTARTFADPRRVLLDALTQPVRFREAVLAAQKLGATRFVEVGPGQILTRLVRRTLPDVPAEAVALPEAVGA